MEIANMKIETGRELAILHNSFPDDSDFYVDEIGHIITTPGRKQTYTRGAYCIHYIIKGKATFNGHEVCAGEGYIMNPSSYDLYISDENEPYEYTWIIVGGIRAKYFLKYCGLDLNGNIFKNPNAVLCGEKIKEAVYKSYEGKNLNLSLIGLLYELMSYHRLPENDEIMGVIGSDDNSGSEYVKKAVKIIHANYAGDLNVKYIAEQVHVSQNYLCRLFNKIIGCSPQAYIAKYRVEISKKLLEETDWKIGIIAETTGYVDSLYFSQIFKKHEGVTPTQYRKKLKK